MRKNSVNVVFNKKTEKWNIFRGLNKAPSKSCTTKREAERIARSFCRKWEMPLALYNKNGTLAQRATGQKRTVSPKVKPVVKKAVIKKKVVAKKRAPVAKKKAVAKKRQPAARKRSARR